MKLPRPEHPRPQFFRPDWLCLNGEWEFEIDAGDSGLARKLLQRPLKNKILVPFCPESKLSGVEHTDFMAAVWYRRTAAIPKKWAGKRLLLHFQAVDYDATVWVNGVEVGRHRGGFTPFPCDLSGVAKAGETMTIVVRARDDHRPPQPRGKQSQRFENHGCHYTRTTGIWQTVWLEAVPQSYLLRPRITPDVAKGVVRVEQPISRRTNSGGIGVSPVHSGIQKSTGGDACATILGNVSLRATLRDKKGVVASETVSARSDFSPRLDLEIPKKRRRLWSPNDPHLYDLQIELLDERGKTLDNVTSYAGLRSVTIDGKAILINGEKVFQRLVLDQGYYPDGIMTAPSDAALRRDIELSLAAGFNGARLHQKVFEERFLFYADKLGYLVWGEFPDWGCGGYGANDDHQQPTASYITQWLEAVERDYSHPSVVGWCPMNETWQSITDRVSALDDVMRGMFLATKAMDTTRPVLDTSGYSHRVAETDIYDCHDYEQDPVQFARNHAGTRDGKPFYNGPKDKPWSIPYRGQPYFVSEFGGIWWNPDAKKGEDSWGYGERVKSIEEFYRRFEGLCNVLLDDPSMFGYCYTQLTDVFQEQNGIYKFDRRAKFDLNRLRAIQQKRAAIEIEQL
jgi:beta-galactosidase/beta-glucuronidase